MHSVQVNKTENFSNQVVSPFAPSIYFTQVDRDAIDMIKSSAENSKYDKNRINHYLAGNIDDEFAIEFEDNDFTVFRKLIFNKIEEFLKKVDNSDILLKGAKMDGAWVNYQTAGEFNPAHIHTGVFSYIIYLDIPECVRNEHTVNSQDLHGVLEFSFNNNFYRVSPKTGDMIIFPSSLFHCVYPFKSDATRISVSGNVYDIEVENA